MIANGAGRDGLFTENRSLRLRAESTGQGHLYCLFVLTELSGVGEKGKTRPQQSEKLRDGYIRKREPGVVIHAHLQSQNKRGSEQDDHS